MTFRKEAVQSILAALRLAKFDADGMDDLNLTADGFWRSFGAAVLLAPFSAIMAAMLWTETEASTVASAFGGSVKYVLSWIVFPIVMIFVARFLGLSGRYVQFIISYNWSSVVQVGLFFALTMLGIAGVVAGELALLLHFIALIYVVMYMTFIARVALGVAWATAAGVVILDVIVELLLLTATSHLLPGG